MQTVKGCPCGRTHHCSDRLWQKFLELTKGKPETVPVGNVRGAWRVPRLYIAMHGLAAEQLAELADRYDWERVE